MTLEHVLIVYQIIAFLFAISVHESAHAWMANLRGDPTARMLGRITLNPIKHIDPIGTILLPAIAAFSGWGILGWAKPTPVNPNNFKNPVLDDVLTSVVGPISNFAVAFGAVTALLAVKSTSMSGRVIVSALANGILPRSNSPLEPVCLLFFALLEINVLLAVFNLIPVPPLDGSHVIRHFLPEGIQRAYDMVGMLGLLLLFIWGGRVLSVLFVPTRNFFVRMLGA
jgi:Zn-dependent protease